MAVKSITRCSVNEMISNVIRIREIIHGKESQNVCRKNNKMIFDLFFLLNVNNSYPLNDGQYIIHCYVVYYLY